MTKLRVAVTGVNGFVGHHMAVELVARDVEVVGMGMQRVPSARNASQLDEYVQADLSRGWPDVGHLDSIVHLAGLSAVGPSFAAPQSYIEANSRMVTHLGESLLLAGSKTRVLLVSSGAVYLSEQSMPLDERSATGATSPYVLSKLLVEAQGDYYARRGLDILIARPFNHVGPGQDRGFLVPDLVAAVRKAAGEGGPIRTGNMQTFRDYTDVRDVVSAYASLLLTPTLGHRLFNVCSSSSVQGTEVLDLVCESLGVEPIATKAGTTRPTDPPKLRGSNRRLRGAIQWEPKIRLEESVRDYVRELTGA